MGTSRTTKERILDAAEAIMSEKSFHSVGLNELLGAVKVPKGSFYHYFESKEQFGVELLKHYVANATAYKRRLLLENSVESNALQRLLTFFEATVAKMCENEGKCACLVVKLASEVADMSEPMREVLAAGQRDWILLIEEVLREGIQSGHIRSTIAADQLAITIWDLWGGAQQRALIQRNVAPLRHAIDFIRQQLTP